MSGIADRLAEVRHRVVTATERSGRDPSSVTLVAVSKTHPAGAIREAYEAGQRDFGENYAQELVEKRAELADLPEIRWHFIGALQSNKARFLVPGTALIHAVDRMSVADALSRRAVQAGTVAEALAEVNVGGEETKAGISADALPELLGQASVLTGLKIRGLMCIPPVVERAEDARSFFVRLRTLRDSLRPRFPGMELLSMGMSHDYEVAIAEGATHVRVGTAIFGPRG
jgi:pyridoxal phosphate enzyme (YggS family)